MMCGGHSQGKAPDQEVIALANSLKSQIEQQAGFTLSEFNVVSYTTQVVAGVNYKLTIKNGDKTLTVVIYKPLPHTNESPSVTSVDVQ